jgi:hypothetical protein
MSETIQVPFRYAPTLTIADGGNHEVGPEENWQESSFIAFVDPVRGLGGLHRIGIQPNQDVASIFSWTQIDGRMVSEAKRTRLPLPHGPVANAGLEGVRFATSECLSRMSVLVDRDGVRTDVVFASFTGPVEMSMDVAGATIGKGHYNHLGEVTGTIIRDGITHAVDGVGFLDHSWGPRDTSGVFAHRWIMAALDADNHINTFPIIGRQGRSMIGYVALDGLLSFVAQLESEMTVADDQLSVVEARVKITDRLGRTVEAIGRAAGEYNIQPLGQGALNVHRPMVYECRGRLWPGIFEWSPVRTMPPWHRDRLGLGLSDEWLQFSGEHR